MELPEQCRAFVPVLSRLDVITQLNELKYENFAANI